MLHLLHMSHLLHLLHMRSVYVSSTHTHSVLCCAVLAWSIGACKGLRAVLQYAMLQHLVQRWSPACVRERGMKWCLYYLLLQASTTLCAVGDECMDGPCRLLVRHPCNLRLVVVLRCSLWLDVWVVCYGRTTLYLCKLSGVFGTASAALAGLDSPTLVLSIRVCCEGQAGAGAKAALIWFGPPQPAAAMAQSNSFNMCACPTCVCLSDKSSCHEVWMCVVAGVPRVCGFF
jgi:hypothetical protein